MSDDVRRLARMKRRDFTTLELAVATERARRRPVDVVLASRDAFCAPSSVCPRALRRAELAVMDALPQVEFIDVSPVQPLGSCSVVTPGSQNRVLSATRHLEVLADPTNALALHLANHAPAPKAVGTCTRVVRTPRVSGPGMTQHFAILGIARRGRDTGGRSWERSAMEQHIAEMKAVLRVFTDAAPTIRVASSISGIPGEPLGGAYYAGLRVQMDVDGVNIADGGLVDWLARYTNNRKRRLFTSGFGLERAVARWG